MTLRASRFHHLLLTVAIVVLVMLPCQSSFGQLTAPVFGKHALLRPVEATTVKWTGGFWGHRFEQCRQVIVPNLWQVMQLPDNAATFHDLRMAAGLAEKAEPGGRKWGDGDCHKCVEAMAHLFAITEDAQLDRWMDEAIDMIAKAQQPDGYLSSWVQLMGEDRWSDLHNHELYNMGHLMTAACVHYQATGKDSYLQVAIRTAYNETWANRGLSQMTVWIPIH